MHGTANRFIATGAIALATLFMAGGVVAQATPSTNATDPATKRVSRADAAFLKQAAQNGHAEVESSKLALEKAAHAQVRSFAQQMVDDHTKAGEELSALARSKGVEVSDEPSIVQKGKIKVLSTADGANFDRRYARWMGVAAHKDTIKLFRKAATGAEDPDVKAFAEKTLPTLEHHLQMAQELEAATAGNGEGKTRTQ